ncbi:MAG: class I SAM-dependent methyltransferase, partial [Chloroflexota bacterium]
MQDSDRRNRLRSTFGLDAELYDRARPPYPEPLFADLARVADLALGSRVLEIGPGTGQATVPMAASGYEVLAIELSPTLAAVARRNLTPYPNAHVVVSSFEEWEPPHEPFDAVVAATAFHWIDPAIRLEKSAAVLRPGGTLAVIDTEHVAGESDFFERAQDCYERWDPLTTPGLRLAPAHEVGRDWTEIDQTELFRPLITYRYERDVTYSTAAYLELVSTYSGHIALEPSARAGLFQCLA